MRWLSFKHLMLREPSSLCNLWLKNAIMYTAMLSLMVTLLSALMSLSPAAGSPEGSKAEKLLRRSPAKIIVAFYEEAHRRNYELIESMHSERVIKLFKTQDALVLGGGVKGYIEEVTRGGELKVVKVIREERLPEGARVVYLVSGKDGKPVERTAFFIKEKGLWKIDQLIK